MKHKCPYCNKQTFSTWEVTRMQNGRSYHCKECSNTVIANGNQFFLMAFALMFFVFVAMNVPRVLSYVFIFMAFIGSPVIITLYYPLQRYPRKNKKQK